MTQQRGFLSFLANSRRKYEEAIKAARPEEAPQVDPVPEQLVTAEDQEEDYVDYRELLTKPLNGPMEEEDEEPEEPEEPEGPEKAEPLDDRELEGPPEQEEEEPEEAEEPEKAPMDDCEPLEGAPEQEEEEPEEEPEKAPMDDCEPLEGAPEQEEEEEPEEAEEPEKVPTDEPSSVAEVSDGQAEEEEREGLEDCEKAETAVEAPIFDALGPLEEPLEGPLEEEESENEEVGDVRSHLAKRRKRLESQLFGGRRRKRAADGWPKQELKEEISLKKEIRTKQEVAFVKRELGQGPILAGPEQSGLLKRRRRGEREPEDDIDSESPLKRGRHMNGLPQSELLRMAGHLERRYLSCDSLAVTA